MEQIIKQAIERHNLAGMSGLLRFKQENPGASYTIEKIEEYINKNYCNGSQRRCWPGDLEDKTKEIQDYVLRNFR